MDTLDRKIGELVTEVRHLNDAIISIKDTQRDIYSRIYAQQKEIEDVRMTLAAKDGERQGISAIKAGACGLVGALIPIITVVVPAIQGWLMSD